ncbi:1,4-dihydroxy-2-naphthoate polyprenyltransferase [Roseimarinus sediminis]|uniref:1,4-dihydroxy-2-naphthoate polyprenyltransferase n=1 Tax=Roseimarinus sediminis TaxID=1610899 RepID=UPI003D1EE972
MKTNKIKVWLKAFRLRTLPLALANAVMGSFLALSDGLFRWPVFLLTVFTITFLQILSNLANDYGDAVSGKDNHQRVGPQRVTVSGLVSKSEIKSMIIAFVLLSFVSGSLLIVVGLSNLSWKEILLFFVLGIAAIVAAIKYTVGRNPYGYKGMGDIFVFIFFGLVGVMGTYYLHTHWLEVNLFYPAAAIGLLSVGVLNVNNLRDIETDTLTGKITLAVKQGAVFAKNYHVVLIATAFLFTTVYTVKEYFSPWQWLFALSVPLFVRHIIRVYNHQAAEELNAELKNLALTTFLFSLLFGLGLLL